MAAGMSSPVLTSWKEIASYLGKGVRTVQRWERRFALPVHRPNASLKGIVCASPEDLDRWMSTHWSFQPENPASKTNGDGLHTAEIELHASHQLRSQLRTEHRRLLNQLKVSVDTLSQSCQGLARECARNSSK